MQGAGEPRINVEQPGVTMKCVTGRFMCIFAFVCAIVSEVKTIFGPEMNEFQYSPTTSLSLVEEIFSDTRVSRAAAELIDRIDTAEARRSERRRRNIDAETIVAFSHNILLG